MMLLRSLHLSVIVTRVGLSLAIGMFPAYAQAPQVSPIERVDCFGPRNARATLVYLHGLDISSLSEQERSNRRIIGRIADELGLRIVAPRSARSCASFNGLKCWLERDEAATDFIARELWNAVSQCDATTNEIGLAGFSNGGLLAAYLAQISLQHKFAYYLVIGIGGHVLPALQAFRMQPVRTIIGMKDEWNLPRAEEFTRTLHSRGWPINIHKFVGGHEVSYPVMRKVLIEVRSSLPITP